MVSLFGWGRNYRAHSDQLWLHVFHDLHRVPSTVSLVSLASRKKQSKSARPVSEPTNLYERPPSLPKASGGHLWLMQRPAFRPS
eukprot:860236-Rhodomonas_salina.4